jgi:hypothetical protein
MLKLQYFGYAVLHKTLKLTSPFCFLMWLLKKGKFHEACLYPIAIGQS